jgi:hypothetical protein
MYEPRVNDYVIWNTNPHPIQGWVYFVDAAYITIEISVNPKDEENIYHCPMHRNTHCLVLCFPENWNELTYIKRRKSIYEEQNNLEILGEGNRRKGNE